MKRCFYQIFKTETPSPSNWGDCGTCIADELNRHCKGYIAITVSFFEVEEENNEKDNTTF